MTFTKSSQAHTTQTPKSVGAAPIFEPCGYVVGYGLNSVSGLSKGMCITTVPAPPERPTGRKLSFELKRIDDYQSLIETLFASASASVSYGLGSGSGSFEFSKTYKASENSIFLLADVSVTWDDQITDYRDLDPAWIRVASAGANGLRRFYEGCGDSYVRGMRKGARFIALYQIFAKDVSERERIKASFGGSYAGTFSGAAEFCRALEHAHQFTHIDLRILSPGFPGGTVPTDAEGITKYVTEFADKVTYDQSVPLTALTGSYTDFPSFPGTNPPITLKKRSYVELADKDFDWVISRLSLISLVKENMSDFDFEGHTNANLVSTEEHLLAARTEISKQAADCFSDATKCDNYKVVDRSKFWIPKHRKINYTIGECTDSSSRFFNFNGGCRDSLTGLVWSAVSNDYWDFSQAEQYCKDLNQNTVTGWILPSVFELAQIQRKDGGYSGFKGGKMLDDYFWSFSNPVIKDPIRVQILLGNRKENENPKLKFKVICRQN